MRNILISFLVLCSMIIGQTAFANSIGEAIENDDMQALNRLLSEGADVNGEGSWTYLHHAAWHGNVKAIRILLANGAVVGPLDGNGQTSFDFLARNNDVEGVRAMLQFGVDINTRNSMEWTPLMTAAWDDCLSVVMLLCKNGADVDARVDYGYTALMLKADGQTAATIKTLLECGADPSLKNDDGQTALDLAIAADYPNQGIIELLKSVTPQ